MKRYRFLSNTYLDFERNIFKSESFSPQLIQQQRERLKGELSFKYGQFDIANKVIRYLQFAPPEICIITEYLDLLHSIADAYVVGTYYPALTGACSLGERIFNIIIIKLRDYFRSHPLYKDVHGKESFQDWGKAITVLSQWKVIDSKLESEYRSLAILRHQSIHFGNIGKPQEAAITALNTVMSITDQLFGLRSDYFFWCPGEIYVKQDKEEEPIVKEFILPKCSRLGYKHTIVENKESGTISLAYQDYDDYEPTQVSDEEYRRLRTEWNTQGAKEA